MPTITHDLSYRLRKCPSRRFFKFAEKVKNLVFLQNAAKIRLLWIGICSRLVAHNYMSRSKQKRAYHIFGRKWVFCTNILGHHWSYTTQNFRLIGQLFRYEIHAQVQVGAHNHSSDQHVTARNSKITLAHTDMCYSKSNIWYTAISQFW